MKFLDFLHYLYERLYEIKDAIMGSMFYSFYTFFYNGKKIGKSALEFFMGVIFSLYVAPLLQLYFPVVSINFLSFACGLLGMKVVEILLEIKVKELTQELTRALVEALKKYINKLFGISDKQDK